MIKLAIWAFIASVGYRVWRNVSAVWKVIKSTPRPSPGSPGGRRPVEAPFEVEDGK